MFTDCCLKKRGVLHFGKHGSVSVFLRYVAVIKLRMSFIFSLKADHCFLNVSAFYSVSQFYWMGLFSNIIYPFAQF